MGEDDHHPSKRGEGYWGTGFCVVAGWKFMSSVSAFSAEDLGLFACTFLWSRSGFVYIGNGSKKGCSMASLLSRALRGLGFQVIEQQNVWIDLFIARLGFTWQALSLCTSLPASKNASRLQVYRDSCSIKSTHVLYKTAETLLEPPYP